MTAFIAERKEEFGVEPMELLSKVVDDDPHVSASRSPS